MTTVAEDKIYWRDIFQAAEHNDIEGVKHFIEVREVPVNSRNYDNETPAHCAARRGQLQMLRYLLELSPELQNDKDIFGNTVLHLATMVGAVDMVKYLVIERDMDIFDVASVHLGNGPVQMAVEAGWLELTKFFVEVKNVDVNMRNRMGQPLVFVAALNKQLHILKYLLEEHNADMFLVDDNNDNILHICSRTGDLNVPIYLIENMKLKYDMNWKDRFGETMLHQAARLNHLAFVKYFVAEKGADFNATDAIHRTPLHEAAEQGHLEMVKYLMDRGASVFVKDNYGNTPIEVSRDKHVIQYLKQYVPPERTRRSALDTGLFSSVRESPIQKTAQIGGAVATGATLPHRSTPFDLNSFLLLSAPWMRHVRKRSYQSAASAVESIRNRIDISAIDAIQAISTFEE